MFVMFLCEELSNVRQ